MLKNSINTIIHKVPSRIRRQSIKRITSSPYLKIARSLSQRGRRLIKQVTLSNK